MTCIFISFSAFFSINDSILSEVCAKGRETIFTSGKIDTLKQLTIDNDENDEREKKRQSCKRTNKEHKTLENDKLCGLVFVAVAVFSSFFSFYTIFFLEFLFDKSVI